MFYFLGDSLTPNWVINSFPIIKFVLLVMVAVAAIMLIIVVLCQESEDEGGTNVITGIKESYYAQNKGASRDGRLKKLTIFLAAFIAVMVIAYFILTTIYPNSIWS